MSQVPTKTGKMMIGEGQFEFVRVVVGSAANKAPGLTDDGATHFYIAAQKVKLAT